ncbi:hypothetical protein A7K94_0207740 [Modestobacter sp. VKM Ac-2676]|nr:hypothetical protein A7K94_0207740 [Modestobacter sp. VKM Ac-2676]
MSAAATSATSSATRVTRSGIRAVRVAGAAVTGRIASSGPEVSVPAELAPAAPPRAECPSRGQVPRGRRSE